MSRPATPFPAGATHGIAQAIGAARKGGPKADKAHFPTLIDGIHGVAFIEAVGAWRALG